MDTKNQLLNPDQHEANLNNLQGVAEEEYGQEKGGDDDMQTQRSKTTKKCKSKKKCAKGTRRDPATGVCQPK
jgi:hypothetical protein